MDYGAEQQMELEALEAIFMDSMEHYHGTIPDDWPNDSIHKVTLKPTDEDDHAERKLVLTLLFAYTPQYPDEAPHTRIQSSSGLTNEEEQEIQTMITEEVENGLGMAMMFNIFESVKEWLRNRANVDVTFVMTEEEKKKLEEEKEEKRIADQRALGVAVTVETFQQWREAFEAELLKNTKKTKKVVDPRLARPTGKQLFEQRHEVFEVEESEEEEDFEIDFDDAEMEELMDDYLSKHDDEDR